MNAEEVLHYLKENPQFFESYADTIAQWTIPHPYGGRTISIAERQLLSLREQNRTLESHMNEMIRYGEENDALGEKMHRLGVALIAVTTFPALLHILNFHLCGDFAIPHVSIRLWEVQGEHEALQEFTPIGTTLRAALDELEQPFCGTLENLSDKALPLDEVAALFAEGVNLGSQALITLRNGGGAIGLIALGSEDKERFYTDMGTLYLERLGEMTSATLARLLR